MTINVVRDTDDGLCRLTWTFYVYLSIRVEIRWTKYCCQVRSSRRHTFDARGSEPVVYWDSGKARRLIGERPAVVPENVLAEVRKRVIDGITFMESNPEAKVDQP